MAFRAVLEDAIFSFQTKSERNKFCEERNAIPVSYTEVYALRRAWKKDGYEILSAKNNIKK